MAALTPLTATLYVAAGGAVGAALRHHAGRAAMQLFGGGTATDFPWGTLFVNVAGSLLMGLLAAFVMRAGPQAESLRLLLGVGLLGGFTTFSAFSLEMMLLAERGQVTMAVAYAAVSVLAGLGALWLGLLAGRVAA